MVEVYSPALDRLHYKVKIKVEFSKLKTFVKSAYKTVGWRAAVKSLAPVWKHSELLQTSITDIYTSDFMIIKVRRNKICENYDRVRKWGCNPKSNQLQKKAHKLQWFQKIQIKDDLQARV